MALFTERMKAVTQLTRSLGEIESGYADLDALKKATVGGRHMWPVFRMAVSVDVLQQVGLRRIVELRRLSGAT